jgi:hypothetical protein
MERGGWIARWGVFGVVALAAANLALFLSYVAGARYRAPFMDALYFLHDALFRDTALWERFSEQRPIAMRLLSRFDVDVFSASGDIFVAVSLASLAAILTVVLIAAWRIPGQPAARIFAGAVALVACCRCYTLEAYVWGHGAQFVLVAAFGVGALAMAALSARPGRPATMIAIGALAVFAVCTYGNGVLVFPLLAWIAWLRRAAPRDFALLMLATLVLLVAFALDARPVGTQSDPAAALARPAAVLDYVVHFLGTPWSRGGAIGMVGLAFGTAILLTGAWIVVALSLRRARGEPVDLVELLCAALLGFAILSALMTALARLDFGPAQAVQSRYGPFAMLGHAAAAILVFKRVVATDRASPDAVAALSLAFLAAIAVEQVLAGEMFRWQARTLDAVVLALQAGSREEARLRQIYPLPEFARTTLDAAKARGVGPFRGASQFVGRNLVDAHLPLGAACEGAIEGLWRRAGAEWQLEGWAREAGTGALPAEVLVADAAGQIVGYGRLDRLRRELPVKFGWHAMAMSTAPLTGISVVALLLDGRACRILGP